MKKKRESLLPRGYVQAVKIQSERPYVDSLSLFGCLQVMVSVKSKQLRYVSTFVSIRFLGRIFELGRNGHFFEERTMREREREREREE